MSTATVENILTQINQLPASERAKVIAALQQQDEAPTRRPQFPPDRIISVNEPYIDRTREYEWLKEHEREYIGQWIALKEDRLLAHGPIAKEVFAKARALGVNDALVLLVVDPDIPYMGF
jgi:hypothetical protein